MNKNFVNNNFQGAINGDRCTDYYRKATQLQADKPEEMIQEIIQLLEIEEIDGVQLPNEYWSKVFLQNDEDEFIGGIKLILNKEDSLYSDSNIAKTLEFMGNLILAKDEKTKETIKVYDSRELFVRALDEFNTLRHSVENSTEGKNAIANGGECSFVMINDMNYKLEKRHTKLKEKDLARLDAEYREKYPIVHEYYVAYQQMREQYHTLRFKENKTQEEKHSLRLMARNIKSLKEDFLDMIDKKSRPIVFKAPLKDEGCPSWEMYDPLDKEHIKYALQVKKGNDLQDDISVIIQDLNKTVDECEFTKAQKKVLGLWREGKRVEDISQILKIKKPSVIQHLDSIVNKVHKKNVEKYSDWYYLNICKGEYKQCTACGEIKLIQYFGTKGDRLRSRCRMCDK